MDGLTNSWLRRMYPFFSRYHQLGNYKMHYIDEGKGKPVVMVHGNPTWSFFFRHLIKSLRKTNRVIAFDHLGCGLSDKPQDYPYRLNHHIDNALSLIKKLDLSDITLIVHDWGGPIGLGMLQREPKLFTKVVIMNTAAFPSENIPSRISFVRIPHLGEWMIRGLNLFAWPATWMATSQGLNPDVKKAYLLPYDSYKNRIAISRFVQDIPMEMSHPSRETMGSLADYLPKIKIPKLIIWGKKDFCFNDSFLNKWRELYPEAKTVTLENAGHYVLEDAPVEVEQAIRDFMQ